MAGAQAERRQFGHGSIGDDKAFVSKPATLISSSSTLPNARA
jgi:hypothetical protein